MEKFRKDLTDSAEKSGLLVRNEDELKYNELKYNTTAIVDRLSEIFLDDILEKAGKDALEGYRSMLSGSLGVEYSGRGASRPDVPPRGVDWVASSRAAMEGGKDFPDEDDLVVRYPESEKIIKAVVAVDVSYSMGDDNKIVLAKKTALALGKMIKNINKENSVKYLKFWGDNNAVTPAQLYLAGLGMQTNIGGALRQALKMLDKNQKTDVGMVYLVTDCSFENCGYDPSDSFRAAKKFSERENYYLRMFFMNPTEMTMRDAKKVARCAGKNSMLIPVNPESLDVSAVEDVASLFKGIYREEEI